MQINVIITNMEEKVMKRRRMEILEKYAASKYYQYTLFLIAGLTAVIMLITFNYMDTQTLVAWSVNTYDLLFENRMGTITCIYGKI